MRVRLYDKAVRHETMLRECGRRLMQWPLSRSKPILLQVTPLSRSLTNDSSDQSGRTGETHTDTPESISPPTTDIENSEKTETFTEAQSTQEAVSTVEADSKALSQESSDSQQGDIVDALTTETTSVAEASSQDRELEDAVLISQMPVVKEVTPPYQSNFPLTSPLRQKYRSTQYLRQRANFVISIKAPTQKETQSAAASPEDKNENRADPDTGYAELGGFTPDMSQGMFMDNLFKLHPTRIFIPGQQYIPEELHPYGAIRQTRSPRRSRLVTTTYSEADVDRKLHFKNLMFLNRYLSDAGMILSRRDTRLTIQLQKRLERSVKTAQALALLPVLDRRSEFKRSKRRPTPADIMS